MTKEEKDLLLRDLCARLPYGVQVLYDIYGEFDGGVVCYITGLTKVAGRTCFLASGVVGPIELDEVKPYLRPMSSMTDKEKSYVQQCIDIVEAENYIHAYSPAAFEVMSDFTNYCYKRHLDPNGLIPKGLALEATEGMYKIK